MNIWVNSNSACLVEKTVKSRVGGCCFLRNFIKNADKVEPKLNSLIRTCKILKIILSPVELCEIAVAFEN